MDLLRTQRRDGVLVVQFVDARLVGDDLVSKLGRELHRQAKKAAGYEGKLQLDLKGVHYMDSAMIGKLHSLSRRCTELGVEFSMSQNSPRMLDLLARTAPDLLGSEGVDLRPSTPETDSKYARSSRIVHEYYRHLMSRIADGILERETQFSQPFSEQAEAFFEMHSRLIYDVGVVYENLKRFASSERTAYRVKVLDVSNDNIESVVNEWLDDNQACLVESVSVSGDSCIVLYLEAACSK